VRLRTYIALISTILVFLIIGVISLQTRKILDRGFNELASNQLHRAEDIIRAVIKSRRENLTRFKKLISADQEVVKAVKAHRLKAKLDELKRLGEFDFVDFIFPDGTSAYGNEKRFGNGANIDQAIDADKFLVVRTDEGLMLVTVCTSQQKDLGSLVLGYKISGFFEKRLSDLTGSKVKFLIREPIQDIKDLPEVPGPKAAEYTILQFPSKTLLASVSLDWSIFDAIDLRLRKSLLYSGSVSLILLLVLLYLLFELGFVRRLENIIGGIKRATYRLDEGDVPAVEYRDHHISELKWLSKAFSQFSTSIKTYDEKAKNQAVASAQMEKQAALASMAQQVAHDIRSPLAAMEMFVDTYDELPEEPRNLMKGCISRALDVANTLLDKFKKETPFLEEDTASILDVPREVYLMSSLIEAIVSEKRVQYQKKEGIRIRTAFDANSYGLFVLLSAPRFKRILSNIIDNAVEAIHGKGEVVVRLAPVGDDRVSILVEDNGAGIPPEILPKLGTRGSTFGKTTGSGLGLHYAKTVIESVGGEFKIESTLGRGTRVEGILARAKAPDWFATEIIFKPETKIVVLDDDPSIHRLWDERLKSVKISSVERCSTGEQLTALHAKLNGKSGSYTYLCDYELLGESKNGLDLIEKLGIQSQSTLVTTHFENLEIQERAKKLGVKIVPKALARFVPLIKQ
jgi:signal transduction histidine kinase